MYIPPKPQHRNLSVSVGLIARKMRSEVPRASAVDRAELERREAEVRRRQAAAAAALER